MSSTIVNGVRLIDDGDMVVKRFRRSGEFEPRTMDLWRSIAREGKGEMLDVGAYTGIYTIAAAQEGARASFIEPMQKLFDRAWDNIELNGVSNIEAASMAASDFDGHIKMWSKSDMSSASKVSAKGIAARCAKIDSIYSPYPIAAIKIDVEGHECAVIRGAMETIKRDKPTIIVECWSDVDFQNVMELLPGYVGAKLEWSNYVLVPRGIHDRRNVDVGSDGQVSGRV